MGNIHKEVCSTDLARDIKKWVGTEQLFENHGVPDYISSKNLFFHIRQAMRDGLLTEKDVAPWLLRKDSVEAPESVEDKVMALAGVLNGEKKIAALMMLDEYPTTPAELQNKVSGASGIKLPKSGSFKSYLNGSFLPYGAANKLVYDGDTFANIATGHFTITDFGKVAQAIGAWSFDYALDNGFSMYSLLGQDSHSGGRNPTQSSVRVIDYLNRDTTITEISKALGVDETQTIGHIKQLERMGLVQYQIVPNSDELGRFTANKVILLPGFHSAKGWLQGVRAALNHPDALSDMEQILAMYQDGSDETKEKFAVGINKNAAVSPYQNQTPWTQRLKEVTNYINKKPGARLADIATANGMSFIMLGS